MNQLFVLQNIFRAISEQFKSELLEVTFRAFSGRFQSVFRAISERVNGSNFTFSEHFQCNFRAV